ncbi:MAG TPA: hypothetical protein VF860_00235 [Candidatus Acidoferrales bacterium]
MKTKSNEYANFENLTRQLVSVPHSEIKAKLDAEKKAKERKKSKKPCASRAGA